jgi:hypothetical protein
MTGRGALGRGVVALLFIQLLSITPAQGQAPGATQFDAEAAKQADIYSSRGTDVPEGYVIDRSLLSYAVVLPQDFRRDLANLGPEDRWLDIGAGEGRAILDYETAKYDVMLKPRAAKAKGVAMSIEDRRTQRWHETAATLEPGRISYLSGRRFREYSSAELGEFQLITDVLGAFSYTRYLSAFMEQALALLPVNGTLYTVLQDVRSETGTNQPFYADSPFLTELVKPDGSELKVCAWLKAISCVQVSCELRAKSSPPAEVYGVRKTCGEVAVPRLELMHYQAGTPPERRFRLRSASTVAAEEPKSSH